MRETDGEGYTVEDTKTFVWRCPKCGRKIASPYRKQLDYNIKAHILKHKTEEE